MCDNQFSHSAGAPGMIATDDDGSGKVFYLISYNASIEGGWCVLE